jgi:hypothetical protein
MAGVGTPAHAGPPGPPGRAGGSAARAGAGQAAPEGGEEDPPGAPPGGGPRGMLAGRTRGAAPTALAHRGWKQQARAAGHGPAGSPAWADSSDERCLKRPCWRRRTPRLHLPRVVHVRLLAAIRSVMSALCRECLPCIGSGQNVPHGCKGCQERGTKKCGAWQSCVTFVCNMGSPFRPRPLRILSVEYGTCRPPSPPRSSPCQRVIRVGHSGV